MPRQTRERQHPPMPAPVALVTGASRGIGAALAQTLAAAGWSVAITARTQLEGQRHEHQLMRPDGTALSGSLASTAQALAELGAACLALPMDLVDRSSTEETVAKVVNHFGRLDLLVNNAVYQGSASNALLQDLQTEGLMQTLWANVAAPMQLAQHALRVMVHQGGGTLINVCSGAGRFDPPVPADRGGWGFAYGASKAALMRLAGCINVEYAGKGIRAFSVNPGLVRTEAVTATLGDDGVLERAHGSASPESVSRVMLWLITDPRGQALALKGQMVDLQKLMPELGITD